MLCGWRECRKKEGGRRGAKEREGEDDAGEKEKKGKVEERIALWRVCEWRKRKEGRREKMN